MYGLSGHAKRKCQSKPVVRMTCAWLQMRVLCDGVIETMQRYTFEGQMAARSFTAHPKIDPESGQVLLSA